MEYLIGDARIPSYNGSNNPPYEIFPKKEKLHQAIDNYVLTKKIPKKLIEKDPVAGFYLNCFSKAKILGITNKDFWKNDKPCGGHMVIEYLKI